MTAQQDHETFLKHLSESDSAVWHVARWLQSRGNQITVPPSSSSERYEDRMKYVDNGDLYIQQRIEVKRRGINFTGKKDWPHRNFIVCAKHAFDNAVPKPLGYFVLSNDMKYAGYVDAKSKDSWTVETKKDSRYIDYTQDFYVTELDGVSWFSLCY